jgi:hypothetical protein
LFIRSGLSPAVMSRAAALSGGDAVALGQLRGVGVEDGGDVLLQLAGFGGECLDALGQAARGVGGGGGHVGRRRGGQAGAVADQGRVGQAGQGVA